MLKYFFYRPPRCAPAVAGVALLGIMSWLASALWLTPAHAARRPGAPRPLRLIWPSAQPPGAGLLAGANEGSNFDGVLVGRVAGETGARGNHNARPQSDNLFFTRQAEGTRNIWRAAGQPPVEQEANAPDGTEDRATRWPSLTWPVTPVTRFAAPLFAAQPAITPDGRTLLCATNAFGDPGTVAAHSQIARLDLPSGRWTPLTPNDADDHAPAIAPDGRYFAFVSSRSGLESIYVMPLAGGPAWRIVTLGRNPCWIGNNMLLFESVRPGQSGLYQLALPPESTTGFGEARPKLLFDRVGEAASAPESHELCVAAPDPRRRTAPNRPAAGSPSQLYLLAPDGAGAHAIPGTEGAGAPHFTPDGSAIIYDAPLDSANSASVAAATSEVAPPRRTLWLMPMLRVPPTARLLNVKPIVEPGASATPQGVPVSNPAPGVTVNAVDVLGTAFAEGSAPIVKLEYGEGSEPTHWQDLPVLPGAVQEGRLATWKLPPGAQGAWTLRLTVTDASHDQAQATLPITLPVYAPRPETLPATSAPPTGPTRLLAGPPDRPGIAARQPSALGTNPGSITPGRVTHSAVATTIKSSRVPRRAISSVTAPHKVGAQRPGMSGAPHSRRLLLAGAVKNLPLPALPPAPTPIPKGNSDAPRHPPTSAPPNGNSAPDSLPTFPQDKPGPAAPPYIPPAAPPTAPQPTPKPPRRRRLPRHAHPPRGAVKAPPHNARSQDGSDNTDSHSLANPNSNTRGEDAARLSVVGTPAIMETGQNVNVSVTLRNTGTRAWATESGQPVRLVYRWLDAITGTRTRWAVRWLQSSVAPGSSAQLAVTVAAPPRPGRYRLTYVLVRLNGDKFEPPPATTPAQRWPGEFGNITYGVTVRAGQRATPLPPDRER